MTDPGLDTRKPGNELPHFLTEPLGSPGALFPFHQLAAGGLFETAHPRPAGFPLPAASLPSLIASAGKRGECRPKTGGTRGKRGTPRGTRGERRGKEGSLRGKEGEPRGRRGSGAERRVRAGAREGAGVPSRGRVTAREGNARIRRGRAAPLLPQAAGAMGRTGIRGFWPGLANRMDSYGIPKVRSGFLAAAPPGHAQTRNELPGRGTRGARIEVS